MGQKGNPVGLRLGVNRTWDSRWFAGRGEYGRMLHEDMRMRDHILQQRRQAGQVGGRMAIRGADHVVPLQDLVQHDAVDEASEADAEHQARSA